MSQSDIAKTARQAADRISSIPNFFGTKARLAKRDEVADIIAAAITKALAANPEEETMMEFYSRKVQPREPVTPGDPDTSARIAETPRIYTRCPACHNDTLTINDDKHLLCTWIKCPDPTLIDKIDAQLAEAKRDSDRLRKVIQAKLNHPTWNFEVTCGATAATEGTK